MGWRSDYIGARSVGADPQDAASIVAGGRFGEVRGLLSDAMEVQVPFVERDNDVTPFEMSMWRYERDLAKRLEAEGQEIATSILEARAARQYLTTAAMIPQPTDSTITKRALSPLADPRTSLIPPEYDDLKGRASPEATDAQAWQGFETINEETGERGWVEAGIWISELDQRLEYWRGLAAGRIAVDVSELTRMQEDLMGLDAVLNATILAGQQAWFGLKVGESMETIWQHRLWPRAIFEDDEGKQEEKAIFMKAFWAGTKRAGYIAAMTFPPLVPLMAIPDYRNWVHKGIEQTREDVAEIIETDWYNEILRGPEVNMYNYAGYGLQIGGSDIPGQFWAHGTPVPAPGTPEREALDLEIRAGYMEKMDELEDVAGTPGYGAAQWHARAALAGIPAHGLFTDFVEDPMNLVGDFAVEVVNLTRRALSISTQARYTAAIARHTEGFTDVVNAVNDARDWSLSAHRNLKRKGLDAATEDALRAEYQSLRQQNPAFAEIQALKHRRGKLPRSQRDEVRQITEQIKALERQNPNYGRMQSIRTKLQDHVNASKQAAHADANWVRMQALLAKKKRGPAEHIIINDLPKANPAIVARASRVYLEALPEEAIEKTADWIMQVEREAHNRVKVVQRRLDNLSPQDDPQFFKNQLDISQQELKDVQDLARWFESKAENPEGLRLDAAMREADTLRKPYAAERLDWEMTDGGVPKVPINEVTVGAEIQRNIMRAVAANAPEAEIMQWELTYRLLQDGNLFPHDALRRIDNISGDDLIKMDIRSSRLAAIQRAPDKLVDIELIDDPIVQYNRATAGPDGTEIAGNAAMILAAGGDISDVYIRSMPVDTYLSMYSFRPRAYMGLDESANSFLGKEAFTTVVEAARWQQSRWESMSDVMMKMFMPRSWVMRPSAFLQTLREPGWVLDSVNPKLGTMLRNAFSAQEFEIERLSALFGSELRALGVLDEAGKINQHLSHKFSRILNYPPDSQEYFNAARNLTFSEMRSVRRIRDALEFMSNKQGLRNSDRRLTGYVSHVFDDGEFLGGTFDPSYHGIPIDEAIYQPYLEARTMDPNIIEVDLVTALDRYTRAASKKIHIEPMLHNLRMAGTQAGIVDPKLRWFHGYVENLISVIQGRPSILGSFVEHNFANKAAWARGMHLLKQQRGEEAVRGVTDLIEPPPQDPLEISSKLRQNVHAAVYAGSTLAYMGALGGNRRYFYMAMATGLATTGARYGMWRTAEGVLGLALPANQKAAKQAGVIGHLERLFDPHGGSDWAKHIQEFSNAASNVHLLSPSLQFAENSIRGLTFNAALSELMTKTGVRNLRQVARSGMLNSYLSEGLHITQNINHRFGMLGRPPLLRRLSESGTTAVTQFLTFPFKQIETLAWMWRENPGYIARYLAYGGALSRLGNAAGVDLGQYVELPGPSRLDTRSIVIEALSNWLALSAELAAIPTGEHDILRIEDLTRRIGQDVLNFVPFSNAARSYQQDISRLMRGAEYQASGEKKRDLDLGRFEGIDPEQSLLGNIARLPLGIISSDPERPFAPTDMLSILTGLRATSANLERGEFNAYMQELKRGELHRRQIADRMTQALNTNQWGHFESALEEAIEKGIVAPDMRYLSREVIFNQTLPRKLRAESANLIHLLDEIIRQQSLQR